MPDSPPQVRAAAVQAEPVVLEREATVEKACRLIAEAAGEGARLIVFPEAFITTYVSGSVWGKGLADLASPRATGAWERLWRNSVDIPSAATDRLGRAARDAGAVVVMGLHERAEGEGVRMRRRVGPEIAVDHLPVRKSLPPQGDEIPDQPAGYGRLGHGARIDS